jgi:hypothetical protein
MCNLHIHYAHLTPHRRQTLFMNIILSDRIPNAVSHL